ncbi:hypothetical protein TNCV_2511751 [Trichonephila clavipes]|nr:hypothetical protein TNCV_2511751 [Trichonephila clavipes]
MEVSGPALFHSITLGRQDNEEATSGIDRRKKHMKHHEKPKASKRATKRTDQYFRRATIVVPKSVSSTS